MTIFYFLIIHWYTSLFFQTFFLHRYSAHKHFTMSPFWEKTFYILSWLTQGFTALSPNVYGKMHRMHHAYADTEKDVHSPKIDKTLIKMMLRTDKTFRAIKYGKIDIEDRFSKNVPDWRFMEKYAYKLPARIFWMFIYIFIYYSIVPENAGWMWILLPFHFIMTPLQGVIVNWFAHRIGYRNYDVSDTSTNLIPFDLITLGEGYHNNHHSNPGHANFSEKWYELDLCYPFIVFFNMIGIIQLTKTNANKS